MVAVDGEATRRAAFSLSTHPGVSKVSVLAPAASRHFPVVDSPEGHDLVISVSASGWDGPDLPLAVADDQLDRPGVYGGSPQGLARALANGSGDVDILALAFPGEPTRGTDVMFPSPIDGRRATTDLVGGRKVYMAPGEGPLGAAMALGSERHRVILDNFHFMEGIALAAAAVLALSDPGGATLAVWEDATTYLAAATAMGLVVGERPARAISSYPTR